MEQGGTIWGPAGVELRTTDPCTAFWAYSYAWGWGRVGVGMERTLEGINASKSSSPDALGSRAGLDQQITASPFIVV